MHRRHHLLALSCSVAALAFATTASAQSQTLSFDIPAQDLSAALRTYGQQAHKQVVFDGGVARGKTSRAVSGAYTPDAALARLLEGTGLQARQAGDVLIVEATFRPQAGTASLESAEAVSEVLVTGSRIRGAPPIAPVIIRSRSQMELEGRSSLAEAIADIPQNSSGGQNPGVSMAVPAAAGVNVNGATSINLRGLGSDATLTLLNGRRLSYSASRQSIDVSSIPFEAVDRIEVVADGASALYGSDAVGGVANIVLRRPYDGGAISARLTGSTESGGGFAQQYDVGQGRTWASGGLSLAAEYGKQDVLWSQERKLTAGKPGNTLYPAFEHFAAVLSMQQDITDRISLDVDTLYNKRSSYLAYAYDNTYRPFYTGGVIWSDTESYMIAPAIKIDLARDWKASLFASYAEDITHFGNRFVLNGVTTESLNCYCNSSTQAEATADGPLFDLPAGAVKAAFGGGYRRNYFDVQRSTHPFTKQQEDYYVYGELSVPLIGEAQNLSFVKKLDLSLAARFEDYKAIDKVVTPKFGLIYAPTDTLELKATWGKSFKAPTLFQQYNVRSFYVYPVTSVGGKGYASNATAVVLVGGNPELKPERATSWTAGLAWRPKAAPGLRLELSYFDVRFRDRIVTPISPTSQALVNALYATQVAYSPTTAQLQAAQATTSNNVYISGATYNPSTVVALIDNTNTNAAEQDFRGVDASVVWKLDEVLNGALSVSFDGSYLDSNQVLIAGAAATQLSGILYYQPKVKARTAIVWRGETLALSGSVAYVGGVEDRRAAAIKDIRAMTTVDLTATYNLPKTTPFRGLELSVGVRNLFDAMPGAINSTLPYELNYDSVNYSAMGRMVSVAVRKRW